MKINWFNDFGVLFRIIEIRHRHRYLRVNDLKHKKYIRTHINEVNSYSTRVRAEMVIRQFVKIEMQQIQTCLCLQYSNRIP